MSKIRILFLDVDGTMTDGKIYISQAGELMKCFNAKDGVAIKEFLKKENIIPVIITNRKSKIVKKRAQELHIDEVCQGCVDKTATVSEIANKYSLQRSLSGIILSTAYIGDDVPDIEAMKMCEFSGCPSDAVNEVKAVATYVCHSKGGEGAVREFIEWIIGRM